MYLDIDHLAAVETAPPRWTVLIPFFNERAYLSGTLVSLAAQHEPFQLVLIDNGSTDGSAAVAMAAARGLALPVRLVTELRPGKVAALQTGLAAVRTQYVATCDADTIYPAHYLTGAERLLDRSGCVAAGAWFAAPAAGMRSDAFEAAKVLLAGAMLPRLCHAGGAGQCFVTEALNAAGGFDPAVWNYVLEDHEVFHRVLARGTIGYAADLWCRPSARDRDRPSVRWTLLERLLYALVGFGGGDWFFYRFLAGRLSKRRLLSAGLRERAHGTEGSAIGPAHPVR